ncbi:NADH-ubiquinone oxidoreductase subunit NI9M [Phycomyces blakesleeanus]|uniref:NADH-ubiquinone oxidoreductase subunit NI9M n=2 Tax=Phycomyces blakesleeanus TaxID=4837 RepID=A0A167J7U7_PHYB8|nr:NADH-ubiquinone oxidoreductase subunit NI9M [Phycomyces blakesleeanus NRRL 1555(-)]OAD65429.1 NADH-ubiquinone oxidoreductase subunit NI9M [Phycomyces blakesleeanus NRRL 1555(-)]|eukprot:XP_018283469.1 NADH-ubiquinone oxidoreductase subunit NI9M [Phycomyces blakesleeanus NRRL 1555(-)]
MLGSVHRFALERPVIFWSFVIGSAGPLMVWTVPTIRREYFGFKGVERLPITYPLPNRARNPPAGYED